MRFLGRSGLNKLEDFSEEQVIDIAEGALTNSQINLIICDGDVCGFLSKMVKEYKDALQNDTLTDLIDELEKCEQVDDSDNDLPF